MDSCQLDVGDYYDELPVALLRTHDWWNKQFKNAGFKVRSMNLVRSGRSHNVSGSIKRRVLTVRGIGVIMIIKFILQV